MLKLNLKTVLKDYAGNPIPESETASLTLGKALSNYITNYPTGGAYKIHILGQKFYQDESIELDQADWDLVEAAVEKGTSYVLVAADGTTRHTLNTMIKGNILDVMKAVKAADAPPTT